MISSLPTNMHIHWLRQEILANDLANASTSGFKRDGLSVTGQPVPPAEPIFAMLGMTPNDHYTVTQWTDYSPGPIHDTGRSLDVAIDGPGFFVVQTPQGLRYTRSGGLTVDRAGLLTTDAGYPIMGGGGPIAVRSTGLTFSATGDIYDGGQILDTLRVVDFPRPYRLQKQGDGLFAPLGPAAAAHRRVGLPDRRRSDRGLQRRPGAHHGRDDRACSGSTKAPSARYSPADETAAARATTWGGSDDPRPLSRPRPACRRSSSTRRDRQQPGERQHHGLQAHAAPTSRICSTSTIRDAGHAQRPGTTQVPTGIQVGHGTRPVGDPAHVQPGRLPRRPRTRSTSSIEGDGFFQMLRPDGTTAYTRAGAFKLDGTGPVRDLRRLPAAAEHHHPARPPSVTVGTDGTVSVTAARADHGTAGRHRSSSRAS